MSEMASLYRGPSSPSGRSWCLFPHWPQTALPSGRSVHPESLHLSGDAAWSAPFSPDSESEIPAYAGQCAPVYRSPRHHRGAHLAWPRFPGNLKRSQRYGYISSQFPPFLL